MATKIKEPNTNKVVSIGPAKPIQNAIEPIPTPTPRDEKGRFLKGFSGNPNAWATRKLNTPLALLCRENVEKWAAVLDSLIMNPDVEPMVKVHAIKLGFEYGYGKPLQGSEVRDFDRRDYDKFISYLKDKIKSKFGNLWQYEMKTEKERQQVKDFVQELINTGDNFSQIFVDVLSY